MVEVFFSVDGSGSIVRHDLKAQSPKQIRSGLKRNNELRTAVVIIVSTHLQ
jgi:hypothetical protein